MDYFDPGRQGGGTATPKLMWPHGEGWAIPSLHVEPQRRNAEAPDGSLVGTDGPVAWRVGVMVQTTAKGASYRFIVVDDLGAFATRWLADPEAVLREEFAYDGTFTEEPSGRVQLDAKAAVAGLSVDDFA